MVRKKGWIRILEATISVMIVMTVLVIVYSTTSRAPNLEDLIVVSQDKILEDISLNKTLRYNVLNLEIYFENETEKPGDSNYTSLNDFVNRSLPQNLGYSIRVCEINATSCKLDKGTFEETLDRDVFVGERIISSEIFSDNSIYQPRTVRLFVWERSLK